MRRKREGVGDKVEKMRYMEFAKNVRGIKSLASPNACVLPVCRVTVDGTVLIAFQG